MEPEERLAKKEVCCPMCQQMIDALVYARLMKQRRGGRGRKPSCLCGKCRNCRHRKSVAKARQAVFERLEAEHVWSKLKDVR